MNLKDKFGKFFIENFRDTSLDYLQVMFDGKWKAHHLQQLQSKVSNLSPEMKAMIYELTDGLLTNAMHDLLCAFQYSHDVNGEFEILVEGQPVAALSDGLHGEIFGEDGWIVRFSKFASEAEIERTRWAEKRIKEMFPDENGEERPTTSE